MKSVRLLPVDERFFTLLSDLADHMPRAAGLLADLLAEPARKISAVDAIKDIEHGAHWVAAQLMDRVSGTFVTPIESEDIIALSHHLDSIIDLIEAAARGVRTFAIETPDPRSVELAGIVATATTILAAAVGHLQQPRKVLQEVRTIHPLEEEGNALHAAGVSALFDPVTGPGILQVIKWKEVFDRLEDAIDECQRAAIRLQRIALKYA